MFQENVYLIKEINDLRRELKISRTQVHDLETSMNVIRKQQQHQQQNVVGRVSPSTIDLTDKNNQKDIAELNKLIDLQKQEMRRLRAQIVDVEAKFQERPHSGNRLPPLQQAM